MSQVAFANEFLRQTSDEKLDERGVSTELEPISLYFVPRHVFYVPTTAMDVFGKAAMVTENDPLVLSKLHKPIVRSSSPLLV